ncbi:hypothetical protein XH99_28215 [Bradyrhizobium nanningense]|uniref:Uncharacterized protein n=1 Tax=Bradyrhizobium nanningense TaxID=1325118 RepID=A0A4Q0S0M8_9BRAD|nr:hypothetical protein XH99_28215 [Bradyrhizobium nanningense]RXH30583.1 hypothetical protein XH84_18860 [Bradyrhizobium nanningense]TQF31697.1 hypothetical protein UNPA324_20245 [Bradyrhizobium sp. UNPA324]
MRRTILLLRVSYWIGAVTDALAAIAMLFPSLGSMVYGLSNFTPGADYRYAMGSAASLMLGWTALLVWADRAPLERRFVLVLTVFPVIAGLAASEIAAIRAEFLPFASVVPTFVLQLALSALFLGSYVRAGRMLATWPDRTERQAIST